MNEHTKGPWTAKRKYQPELLAAVKRTREYFASSIETGCVRYSSEEMLACMDAAIAKATQTDEDHPKTAAPMTDALIEAAPFSGSQPWVGEWDKAIDSHRKLETDRARLMEALRELLRVDDDWHGSVNSEMAQARTVARALLRELEGK